MLQRLKSYNNVTSNIHVYKSLIVVRYLVKLKLKKAIPHDKTKQSYRYNTIIYIRGLVVVVVVRTKGVGDPWAGAIQT